MGQVIPWKRAGWIDLLQLKWFSRNGASEFHIKYFTELYKKQKQDYVADSY